MNRRRALSRERNAAETAPRTMRNRPWTIGSQEQGRRALTSFPWLPAVQGLSAMAAEPRRSEHESSGNVTPIPAISGKSDTSTRL